MGREPVVGFNYLFKNSQGLDIQSVGNRIITVTVQRSTTHDFLPP